MQASLANPPDFNMTQRERSSTLKSQFNQTAVSKRSNIRVKNQQEDTEDKTAEDDNKVGQEDDEQESDHAKEDRDGMTPFSHAYFLRLNNSLTNMNQETIRQSGDLMDERAKNEKGGLNESTFSVG